MSKRKHNESSKAVAGQAATAPPTKKPKVVHDNAKATQSRQTQDDAKSTAASPDSKRQSNGATLEPTTPQQEVDSGRSKTALKRRRQSERRFEARKNPASRDNLEQATKETNGKRSAQKQPTKSTSGKLEASSTNTGRKLSNNKAAEHSQVGDKPSPPTNDVTSSKELPAGPPRSNTTEQTPLRQKSKTTTSSAAEKITGHHEAKVSKHKKRRQKLAQAKRDELPSSAANLKGSHDDAKSNRPGPDQSSLESGAAKQRSPENRTLQHETTQTNLLPRPAKQWVDETEQNSPDVDATLQKEVSKTLLIPRPTKEWVDQDQPIHASTLASDPLPSIDTPKRKSANAAHSSRSATKSSVKPSPHPSATDKGLSSTPKISSAAPADEAERPFATVGLPPATTTPLTRPGISTIASFSLSSRRHPANILAKGRKISGLSDMKMDTGSIGSASKPMSSVKASSVPSYSGRGDVKAAFAAFNKFAHGGESSASDEDSDDSESEVEVEAKKPAAKTAGAVAVEPSVATKVSSSTLAPAQKAQEGDAGQPETAAHVDKPTEADSDSSADSSESEDAAMTNDNEGNETAQAQEDEPAPVPDATDDESADDAHDGSEDSPTQPPSFAPQAPVQKELPLFSDFKAKHNMLPTTNTSPKTSSAFLGQENGGTHSGPGPFDDQSSSSQLACMGEYHASQDPDDLYRSIEDISREVFGSTRALPDCKPLSSILKPSLDVVTAEEPFVTDYLSGYGLEGRLSTIERKMPDKAVSLHNIVRSSSPMVYIVITVNVGGESVSEANDGRLSGDEEQDAESQSVAISKKVESNRYSSPPSSLSSLTPSPRPPPRSLQQSRQATPIDDDIIETQPLDQPAEDNEQVKPTEGDERKESTTASATASADLIAGALEVGHIPGLGPYAWDSWRIFCRDVLRGVADDYNGKNARDGEGFEPEWQRVLPLDKELRACLRWMWLREGWVWDWGSGERREATGEERRAGEMGEMKFEDGEEGRVGEVVAEGGVKQDNDDVDEEEDAKDVEDEEKDVTVQEVAFSPLPVKRSKGDGSRRMSIARRELDVESGDEVDLSSTRRRTRRGKVG